MRQTGPHARVCPQRHAIAITGMACRLPGGAASPEKLWNLLVSGRSGHCEVPRWRYNAEGFYHPDNTRHGSINSMGGYFIQEDVRNFENQFFGINNLEAVNMDPQQRKLLEVAYECFESAGLPIESLSGADVGCYVATYVSDCATMLFQDPEYLDRYAATGSTPTILANRISHVFDLLGPSMAIDTACSASVYAVHQACVALEVGDCESALVASANLIQSPQNQMLATRAGVLSNSASCKTFDISADGYGRAEGVGALHLKRLEDAIRDGDPIRAVIRGTAVNSNGKTNGIMLPSAQGQQQVIEKAYSRAGLAPDETDYVEAHGTGTAVGDPIEVEAISKTFNHHSGRPTLIGSVKTVLGHSEANSGISSIIKSVLALEHRVIPPTIGIEAVNPEVRQAALHVDIVQNTLPWPETRCPRISINSFGFGGANGHVILDSADCHTRSIQYVNGDNGVCHDRKMILPISARTSYSLSRCIEDLENWDLMASSDRSLASVAHTLANRRSRLLLRGYMVVDEEKSVRSISSIQRPVLSDDPNQLRQEIAFIFTGQGAQWPHMGRELYHTYPVFRRTISELDDCIDSLEEKWLPSIADLMTNEIVQSPIDFDQPAVAQVLCTALQIGLTDLLRDWTIEPSAVAGHSSGEIAAAYAAQLITKQWAIVLAFYRGYTLLSQPETQRGAMLAASLDESTAQSYLAELKLQDNLVVACVNSPCNVTFSGDEHAIDLLKGSLDDHDIFNRKLKTYGTAYHSRHMQGEIGKRYEESISEYVSCNTTPMTVRQSARMISSVDGDVLTHERAAQPSYWRANLESPVQFHLAISCLYSSYAYHTVEIGPHPALQMYIKQTMETLPCTRDQKDETILGTLFRNKDNALSMLELAGNLYMSGHDPDFDKMNKVHYAEKRVVHSLPSYPWDYGESMGLKEPEMNQRLRNRRYPRHELLGSLSLDGNVSTLIWRNRLSVKHVIWLRDHRLGPTIIFPAAGYLAMVIEAMCQVQGVQHVESAGLAFRHVKFLKALPLSDNEDEIELFTEVSKMPISAANDSAHWWQFRIESKTAGVSTRHVSGLVCLHYANLARSLVFSSDTLESQAERIWYNKLTDVGLNWGPKFKLVEQIFFDRLRQRLIAQTRLPMKHGWYNDRRAEHEYIAHPTVIDTMLQTVFFAAAGGRCASVLPRLPVSIEEFTMAPITSVDFSGSDLWNVSADATPLGCGQILGNAEIFNSQSQVLFKIRGERAIVYQGLQELGSSKARAPVLRMCWKPDVDFPIDDSKLIKYLDAFARRNHALNSSRTDDLFLAGCLDLVLHKSPREACLSLGIPGSALNPCAKAIGEFSLMRRFTSFHDAFINENGEFSRYEMSTTNCQKPPTRKGQLSSRDLEDYGIVIADLTKSAAKALTITELFSRFTRKARFVLALEEDSMPELVDSGRQFRKISLTDKIFAIVNPLNQAVATESEMYLVGHDFESQLNKSLYDSICHRNGKPPLLVKFEDITATTFNSRASIIFTAEYDMNMLGRLLPGDMTRLKHMTKDSSRLLWVTHGNVTKGEDPESVLAFGMARAIMLEQPALKFACFDVDQDSNVRVTANNVVSMFQSLVSQVDPDTELAQIRDVVKVSRWIPDDSLNQAFQETIEGTTSKTILGAAGICELTIKEAGQLDTIHFKRINGGQRSALSADQVEIDTKCFGMNAKDLYLLNAKFGTPEESCSCEFGGVVRRLGSTTSDLTIGDRVMVMYPGRYRTREVVPSWACVKLLPHEDFESMSTIPLVFATSIYAFKHQARLKEGESVLIHSATGGLGLAAIQIANLIGAKVFATAGTPEKRKYLIEELGIPADRVFSSRDSSFLPAILATTQGQGVDVVLNSLAGDLLQDSFKACAKFGRFIELGKKDILENGRLDMSSFSRSVTFVAFDLVDLLYSKHEEHRILWNSLFTEVMRLLRTGQIKAISPLKTFDISETTKAFRYFSQSSRMGKVAISLHNPTSMIDLVPEQYDSVFDSDKTYLMIGGLGGIGRSISRWMRLRGAQSFVYLSRTGTSSPAAKQLVEDLEFMGAHVEIIVGDVSVAADVQAAVSAAPKPIGGVIQASMSIKATHWESLTHADWIDGLNAKLSGCWNVHHALNGKAGAALDFFLLLSSLSGTIGSMTESNYCAANAFMDNFARFRRSKGLPATSLGLGVISEVGYLHDRPEMEVHYLRRGLQSIPEHEMLRLVDLAITNSNGRGDCDEDDLMKSHMITGLEINVAKAQILEEGSSVIEVSLRDPRAGILAGYLSQEVAAEGGCSLYGNGAHMSGESATSRQLPRELRESMARGQSLETALSNILAKKFANMVMLSTDKLKLTEPLVSFGLDSMLAAEFRTYVFQSTGVDLSFMKLMSSGATIQTLIATILDKIHGSGSQ